MMFIPIPIIWLVLLAFAACIVLLIVSELQIKAVNRSFWEMSDNARQSQETAKEAGMLAKHYEEVLRSVGYGNGGKE